MFSGSSSRNRFVYTEACYVQYHYQCFVLFPSPRLFCDPGTHRGTVLILVGFRIVEPQNNCRDYVLPVYVLFTAHWQSKINNHEDVIKENGSESHWMNNKIHFASISQLMFYVGSRNRVKPFMNNDQSLATVYLCHWDPTKSRKPIRHVVSLSQ